MPRLTRRTTLAAAAAALAAAPASARAQAAPPAPPVTPMADRPLFGAKQWQLSNGLRVVLAENRRAPVVAQYLFYAAGGAEDPAGRSGVAHFLEHMMFKGSPNVANGEFSRRVGREGGNDNAFTSRDVTAYYQQVEASRLPLIMRMEADRFAAALIPADQVESERSVVIEERRQRTDSSARARFQEAFRAALWGPQTWPGRPIIGWEDEIRAITRDDLVAFYDRFYAPHNATLVVSGAVDEATLRALAEEHYGRVPARPGAARDRARAPATPHEPRLVRREPTAREALLLQAWMAPSLTAGATRHALPLEVLAHLLGSGQGSRLHAALVETGLAVSAGASYDGEAAGETEFMVYAVPRRGVAPERLEQATAAVIATLLADGPTEAEVARSRRQLSSGALLALDGFGAAPRMLGGVLAIGLPTDVVEFWPARLRAVTQAEVTEAARAVLGTPRVTTGWLLPEAV
ncbi:pitrilysin family protein [Roseomonas sp. CECT 9278]|uniref:M16 family metallopeptidase n=1 Tax=Roseomonas sp. CECT 9278 TaxID=2845823 RepID=UPI001E4C9770|nr:pitrilysin family protein [Roseomonas sp. CECT 9278]CAH0273886.1 putative zinc protease [Roseomonas sp. CECT 9278]